MGIWELSIDFLQAPAGIGLRDEQFFYRTLLFLLPLNQVSQ